MQRTLAFKQNLLGSEREDRAPPHQRKNRQWIGLPSLPGGEKEACVARSLPSLLPLRYGRLSRLSAAQGPPVPGTVSIYGGLCLEVQLPETGTVGGLTSHPPDRWEDVLCFIPFLFGTSVLLGGQVHLFSVLSMHFFMPIYCHTSPLNPLHLRQLFTYFQGAFLWECVLAICVLFCELAFF